MVDGNLGWEGARNCAAPEHGVSSGEECGTSVVISSGHQSEKGDMKKA